MARRPVPQPASLTSLLDVLFILVFAALVQVAGSRAEPTTAAPEPATPTPPPDAGVPPPDAAPRVDPDVAALRAHALAELTSALAARPVLIARVGADGVLTAVEHDGGRIPLGTPLVEHVPDPDVVIAYLGDRAADLRICRVVALRLGAPDLADRLVVIAPDAPLADLPVALVGGLRRDAERCLAEQGAVAVVVDPAALPPVAPEPP